MKKEMNKISKNMIRMILSKVKIKNNQSKGNKSKEKTRINMKLMKTNSRVDNKLNKGMRVKSKSKVKMNKAKMINKMKDNKSARLTSNKKTLMWISVLLTLEFNRLFK